MEVSAGSVIIRKGRDKVIDFVCNPRNFQEQFKCDAEFSRNFNVQLKGDLSSPIFEGQELSIQAFSKDKGARNMLIDFKIGRVQLPNFAIVQPLSISLGNHSEAPLPFDIRKIECAILFDEHPEGTRVRYLNHLDPSASLFYKLVFYLFHLFGVKMNQQYKRSMTKWKEIVERHA